MWPELKADAYLTEPLRCPYKHQYCFWLRNLVKMTIPVAKPVKVVPKFSLGHRFLKSKYFPKQKQSKQPMSELKLQIQRNVGVMSLEMLHTKWISRGPNIIEIKEKRTIHGFWMYKKSISNILGCYVENFFTFLNFSKKRATYLRGDNIRGLFYSWYVNILITFNCIKNISSKMLRLYT